MNFLKNNRGITGIDVGIATVVIVLFVSIITTLFYNIYSMTTQTKRNAEATAYISRVFENLKRLDYNDVTEEEGKRDKLLAILNEIFKDSEYKNEQYEMTISGYKINLNIENYSKEGIDVEDVIKKVLIKAQYSVGKKDKTLEMSTIINKEQ